jgi:DNA-binding MarR family transcriptional regulator
MSLLCPNTEAVWTSLARVEQALLIRVEADVKAAGFPSIGWYDVLIALTDTPEGQLRPVDLERKMLLPQYSTSRLVDRLEKAGLVERKVCPVDGRGQFVAITPEGRKLQKKMWPTCAAAIRRHIGDKLSPQEHLQLHGLLQKLLA